LWMVSRCDGRLKMHELSAAEVSLA